MSHRGGKLSASGQVHIQYSKKKFAVLLSLAGMSLTKLSLAGIIKLFPARGELVSDIPAGDGKIDNLFYSVRSPLTYLLTN